MQLDTREQIRANFVIEHGPVAETHRMQRHLELDAAWRVALALRSDTINQHASVAAEQGHKAKLGAAKVPDRRTCVQPRSSPALLLTPQESCLSIGHLLSQCHQSHILRMWYASSI